MAITRSKALSPAAEQALAEGRTLLAELRDRLARLPATEHDTTTLANSIRQLDDLFLLVVVGEFNAGKSALINALLGERVVEEGVTPTTAHIEMLRYGDGLAREVDASGMQIITAPMALLRDLHIVDTPGTNAINRAHERLTVDFVPRADLVLFVTSADRPFTETERLFLESIRNWGKNILLVVNKVDIFENERDLTEVVEFVRESSLRLLGILPEVFPLSARLAAGAKRGDENVRAASRFEALERHIQQTLDDVSRFRLKLANPLGVGDALARRYEAAARERNDLLATDIAAVADIERQLALYLNDIAQGFELRMTAVEKGTPRDGSPRTSVPGRHAARGARV